MKETKKRIPHRAWLKVYLAAAVGIVLAGRKVVDKLELAALTSGIPDKIPPFLDKTTVPEENKDFRPMVEVVSSGIKLYEGVAESLSLPKPFYSKPKNYLDEVGFTSESMKVLIDKDNKSTLGNKFKKVLNNNDLPYANISKFSELNIDGLTSPDRTSNSICLILGDPGSGMVNLIREYFKEYKNDPTFEIYDAVLNRKLSGNDEIIIEKLLAVQMENFQNFMKRIGPTGPVSSSYALTYFLIQNKGDIVKSLWDTTLALKLLARNEFTHFRYKASRSGAEALARIIVDEQSPKTSLNWLVNNISRQKELEFYGGKGSKSNILEYANFMPAFKAGVIYHAWNIVALIACMSPFLVQRTVDIYYIATQSGGADKRLLGGIDKTASDLLISQQAEEIAALLEKYRA